MVWGFSGTGYPNVILAKTAGTILPEDCVHISDGMIFEVADTSNA